MQYLLMAMISYGVAVLLGTLGFAGLVRGAGKQLRIAFAVALAITCGLILAAGASRW